MAFTLKINGTPHEVDVDGDYRGPCGGLAACAVKIEESQTHQRLRGRTRRGVTRPQLDASPCVRAAERAASKRTDNACLSASIVLSRQLHQPTALRRQPPFIEVGHAEQQSLLPRRLHVPRRQRSRRQAERQGARSDVHV